MNYDFIVTSISAWDFEMGNNAKNLAEEIAKTHRVLYVNPPLDRITIWKEKHLPSVKKRLDIIAGKKPAIEQVNPNLWVLTPKCVLESVNWVKNKTVFGFLNKLNNIRLAKSIRESIRKLNFTSVVIFNDSDMFRGFHLKEMLKPKKYVYYSRDNLMAVPYWHKHGQYYEPNLIKKSDIVTANSVYLSEIAQKHNPNSHYIGQGCDLSLFDETKIKTIPNDIASISKPIIGYTGALINMRLDIQLLIFIAKNRPDWNIVLVGPEDESFLKSDLHSYGNVYFLGAKKMEELPAYVKAFDVCINPQKLNEVTIGNYPRKVDEYLALGKPVVATKTKAMEIFFPHVYLAKNYTDYLNMIELALTEISDVKKKERIALAYSHSWENNVAAIYNLLSKTT
jgi:glycosyltransferase involved in cell wall biosynthesis